MEDTELYMLTPILENLSKVDDVRTFLRQIIYEDRVLFNKAALIFQGGKVGERSHSQNPKLRQLKAEISEASDEDLNQQSGDLKQDITDNENNTSMNDYKAPAMSYFKSFPNKNARQSRTSNLNNQKRNNSQKRSLMVDAQKLHFMPHLDKNKQPVPIETVKNGWVNKYDVDQNSGSQDNSNKFQNSEERKQSPNRVPAIVPKNELVFQRNDTKTSSINRNYRKKYKLDKTPTRYGNYSNRNSGEFKTIKKKRDLILIGTNKPTRSMSRSDLHTLTPTHNPAPANQSRNLTKIPSAMNTQYNFVSKMESDLEVTGHYKPSQATNYILSKILNDIGSSTVKKSTVSTLEDYMNSDKKPKFSKGHRNYISNMVTPIDK